MMSDNALFALGKYVACFVLAGVGGFLIVRGGLGLGRRRRRAHRLRELERLNSWVLTPEQDKQVDEFVVKVATYAEKHAQAVVCRGTEAAVENDEPISLSHANAFTVKEHTHTEADKTEDKETMQEMLSREYAQRKNTLFSAEDIAKTQEPPTCGYDPAAPGEDRTVMHIVDNRGRCHHYDQFGKLVSVIGSDPKMTFCAIGPFLMPDRPNKNGDIFPMNSLVFNNQRYHEHAQARKERYAAHGKLQYVAETGPLPMTIAIGKSGPHVQLYGRDAQGEIQPVAAENPADVATVYFHAVDSDGRLLRYNREGKLEVITGPATRERVVKTNPDIPVEVMKLAEEFRREDEARHKAPALGAMAVTASDDPAAATIYVTTIN